MLTNRITLPTDLRSWLDDRRWRRAVTMEFAESITDRLWAYGYRFSWRASRDVVIGHTLAGERVTIPVEEFISRYIVGAE